MPALCQARLGCEGPRVNRVRSCSRGANGLGEGGGGYGDVWPCHTQLSARRHGAGRAGPPGVGVLPRLGGRQLAASQVDGGCVSGDHPH